MSPIEIIVIVITSLIVIGVIGNYVYRKIKHLPTGECACCKNKYNSILRKYHKKYPSSENK